MAFPVFCSLSTPTLLSLLFSSLFLALWLLRSLWPFTKGNKRYPPLAGTIFHQLFHVSRIYDYHTDLSRRYKTFRILALTRGSYICTTDPANVEHILKSNFANYGKGPTNSEFLETLLGEGIFAVDGDKWRLQRKLASHEFSTKVLRDFSSAVFRTNAAKLAWVIFDLAGTGTEFDIQRLLKQSTLDSIVKVGFGVDLDVLQGSSAEFARAFDEATASSALRFVDPFWKLKKFFNVGSEAALRRNVQVVDDFVYRVIRQKSEQASPSDKEDILSRFLAERRNDPETMTDKYLRDITLNFMVAGRDTTAGTLSWFFYMLCRNPSVQEKVHQEIREAVDNVEQGVPMDEFSPKLTESALGKMHYLHAALSETLRLYPAVPLDGKYCFGDDTLPDGHAVRKGDMVDYQPYPMGRMEHLWGLDADVFRPERWLDESGTFRPESPFKFTAFQSGPRVCLGREFAYRQMKIFAATMLFFLRFELRTIDQIVHYSVSLTLPIDGGLHLKAVRR